ncbi:hypothetical protein H10PHJ05_64 [Aeromonas phage HJ05]|nr:hypothetical protein H10PHJ05_64 [Aeromonas phage HJ05]
MNALLAALLTALKDFFLQLVANKQKEVDSKDAAVLAYQNDQLQTAVDNARERMQDEQAVKVLSDNELDDGMRNPRARHKDDS